MGVDFILCRSLHKLPYFEEAPLFCNCLVRLLDFLSTREGDRRHDNFYQLPFSAANFPISLQCRFLRAVRIL